MMNFHPSWSAKEARLLARGNIKQLGRDIRDFHLRADDPLATGGSIVMAPAAAIAKAGNAIAGEFSPEPAVPLGDGAFKYMTQGVTSLKDNTIGAVRNIVTLHPVKALGNVVKGGFDAVDLVTADPWLDLGSNLVGHQHRKTTRAAVEHTLSTAL